MRPPNSGSDPCGQPFAFKNLQKRLAAIHMNCYSIKIRPTNIAQDEKILEQKNK
jgi:hypothetical protein